MRENYPDMGYWAAQLMYYGFQYIGVSIPQMTVEDVDEIVTELETIEGNTSPRYRTLVTPVTGTISPTTIAERT